MLKEKPDLVRRFLRATLRALLWFRANEKEARWRAWPKDLKSRATTRSAFIKATLKSYTLDGTISREPAGENY